MKYIMLFERLLAVLFFGLLTFGFDSVPMATLTILTAFIHECGHLTALAYVAKDKFALPKANLFGFRIKNSIKMSYTEEILVTLSGPLVNLILSPLVFIPTNNGFLGYLQCFGAVNLMTLISNLIPVRSYDGSRILSSILALHTDEEKKERIISVLSLFFSSLLTLFSLYVIEKMGEGYWIFIIFFPAAT